MIKKTYEAERQESLREKLVDWMVVLYAIRRGESATPSGIDLSWLASKSFVLQSIRGGEGSGMPVVVQAVTRDEQEASLQLAARGENAPCPMNTSQNDKYQHRMT